LGYGDSLFILAYMEKSLYTIQQQKLQELLRQIRIDARLRQTDLAERLGEPQSFVSKYESGERRLDVLEIRLICKAVGITFEEFARRLESALLD
jgi:transcriptional regulator with XRE-family HTH domain